MVSSAAEESSLMNAILAQGTENCPIELVNRCIVLRMLFKTLFLNS